MVTMCLSESETKLIIRHCVLGGKWKSAEDECMALKVNVKHECQLTTREQRMYLHSREAVQIVFTDDLWSSDIQNGRRVVTV